MRTTNNFKQGTKFLLTAVCTVFLLKSNAKEYPNTFRSAGNNAITSSDCLAASSQIDLDINNVRARILGGGDMWWDQGLAVARYEIPKGSNKFALFASSLWIGGIDAGGQLKVAAQTYRQTGNDFWPGPLDTIQSPSSKAICDKYDRHWKITRAEVEKFRDDNSTVPAAGEYQNPSPGILDWPGNQLPGVTGGYDKQLAPFYDNPSGPNGADGEYNPADGDYPYYNFSSAGGTGDCEGYLYGDQTIWWVINDKGNIHTETSAQPIGLEIQCQAFGFQTGDEVNNMTFYQYKVINRSSFKITNTYFGYWVDADLGDAYDDFVGCDVPRGVAFTYNSDEFDGTNGGYGASPPAIGIDFFKGPLADPDGVDNPSTETKNGLGFGDGITDNERLGMEKCIVFINNSSPQGNPYNGTHIYNYLRGRWKDGTPLCYGGNGTSGTPTDYMYSWDTDPAFAGQPSWQLTGAAADLRTVQSAGPFTLNPGAINYVTAGAVWARSNTSAVASVAEVINADKKAQQLFDNCFKIADGPTAPTYTIQEIDQEIIITLSNEKTSNNYRERYKEVSPDIANPINPEDLDYEFEGYQIFQLKNATVSADNLNDASLARLVAQCDIKNNVDVLVNKVFDATLGADKATIMVSGENKGIRHSFNIKEDAFNPNTKLINYKKYYYLVRAYAYNNYQTLVNGQAVDAQKKPFFSGRKNIEIKQAIPHIPAAEQNGTIAQAIYGSGPVLTREEGQGNGGNFLDLTDESVDEIVGKSIGAAPVRRISYKGGKGPVSIKVIDPLNVPNGEFELTILPQIKAEIDGDSVVLNGEDNKIRFAQWKLVNKSNSKVYTSEQAINFANEQILPEIGLSITANQVNDPGSGLIDDNNGFIDATITFGGEGQQWLTGVKDEDGDGYANWIRSGTHSVDEKPYPEATYNDWINGAKESMDEFQFYEGVLGGTWAPYRLTSAEPFGPMINIGNDFSNYAGTNILGTNLAYKSPQANRLQNVASVNVVFTADKSKWTRCPVIETGFEQVLNENALGYARPPRRGEMRSHKSVDKNGKVSENSTVSTNPEDANYLAAEGMGWFPGYAINVETGERLNVAFGESSYIVDQNGNDMIWNPTNVITDDFRRNKYGGAHFIYVFNHNSFTTDGPASTDPAPNLMPYYDGGVYIHDKLLIAQGETMLSTTLYTLKQVWRDCIWTSFSLLAKDRKILENTATVKLRVTKPYARFFACNPYNYQYRNGVLPANTFIGFDPSNTAVSETATNNNDPRYSFSTKDLATLLNQNGAAKNALNLINVVPNPYYAYSDYEQTQIDNIVKITNLPIKCLVSIYTVSGTLIRQINKDNDATYLDWDLKNQSNIPIGSGMYIIHVNAPNIGEKTIKWFGALRPIDLNAF